MDERTLEALRGSILKWEKIVAGTGEDHGSVTCPLCELFNDNRECEGCPVSASTGRGICDGTPYQTLWSPLYVGHHPRVLENPDAMAAAQAELEFLRSLLPRQTSYPFLRLAQQYGADYGTVLSYADAVAGGFSGDPTVWQTRAVSQLHDTDVGRAVVRTLRERAT